MNATKAASPLPARHDRVRRDRGDQLLPSAQRHDAVAAAGHLPQSEDGTFGLSFSQIGLVTLTYQITASILQPLIGLYADKKPTPLALPGGTLFSLAGLLVLSARTAIGCCWSARRCSAWARRCSIPNPRVSRAWRRAGGMAWPSRCSRSAAMPDRRSGRWRRRFVVVRWGQSSLAFFAMLALLSCAILWNVGQWYQHHGLARLSGGKAPPAAPHPHCRAARRCRHRHPAGMLIFSKYVYLASLTSYFTFYLIHRFGVSVQVAQFHLFIFLGAVAVGTVAGGPLGDRFGRKYVIWFSILGVLPFTLLLPHASLFWTGR
jgi:FSR family fosmidomycin resistance protein-like MFS transporter